MVYSFRHVASSTKVSIVILVFATTAIVDATAFICIYVIEERVFRFFVKNDLIPEKSKPIISIALEAAGLGISALLLVIIYLVSTILQFSLIDITPIVVSIIAIISTVVISSVHLYRIYENWVKKIDLAKQLQDDVM